MYRLLFILLLLIQAGFSAAQTVGTRNNYTGAWTHRSSWEQDWAGISNPTPLPVATINVYGYVTVGTYSASASIELPASASAVLNVYDTLRIHGNLNVATNALVNVEPGGVLIVHGYYNQWNLARLNNKGTMIIMNDFKVSNIAGASANTGKIYVGGQVSPGARFLNPNTLTDLAAEAPVLSTFAHTNVISYLCAGSNNGTLTFSGIATTVIRWESSTDFFKSNIQQIASTSTQLSYSNLTRTTSYRVFYQKSDGTSVYSNGATLIISESVLGGEISGPNEFCGTAATVSLTLTKHTGTIKRWEWSTDNFATTPQSSVSSSENFSLTNLTTTTYVRAIVSGCTETPSAILKITIHPVSNGGTIQGPALVCKGSNSGILSLQSKVGNVLRWEVSNDGFAADIRTINNTSDTHSFTNLSAATWYRAVVQSGICAIAYSPAFKIDVTEIHGGTLTGPERVCAGTNSGTVQLQDHIGTIKRWEWSNDGFQTHVQTIAHTLAQYSFTNISADTWYRAVIGNTECGEKTSTVHVVRTDATSLGGTIAGTASVCKETNSGTLTLSGHRGQILNWEFSNDGFISHVENLVNTSETLTFSNLSADRWYRAVVKNGLCNSAVSAVFKVTVTNIAGGSVSGPERVCEGTNSGVLKLESYLGTIKRWERSNDGFMSNIQTIASTQAEHTFNNLTGDTWFRAVVGNAECGEKASTAHVVRYDQLSLGGTISGTSSVCKGTNTGTLTLAGHRGSILRWEYSTDEFVSHVQAVANTSTIHTFSNLSSNRWYRAVVQNGSCVIAYSPSFKITVSELAGGTLSGPAVVCQEASTGQLILQDYVGAVIRWESSNDGFTNNIQSISHTSSTYTFTNITGNTWFRAMIGNADCGEVFSATWQVQTDQPSLGGTLAGATSFCTTTNSGTIQLESHRGAVLRWETSTDNFGSNVQVLNSTTTSITFNNLIQTTSYRALVQNGSCSEVYSAQATVTIHQPSAAGAVAGAATVCYGENSGLLVLESKVGQVIRWESSADNFATVIEIPLKDISLPYQNLNTTASYRAVVQNGDCAVAYSSAATITVLPPTQAGGVTPDRVVISGSNSGDLNLIGNDGQILYWQLSIDGFVSHVEQLANTTATHAYQNLTQTTWYRAVTQSNGCSLVYSNAAKVTVNHAPLAHEDVFQVTESEFIATVSVLQNDTDPDGDVLKVIATQLQTAAGGNATINENGILTYQPSAHYLGTDSLRYTVCDGVTGAVLCAEALIILDVRLPVPALVVYQGVSPNGDNSNEYWRIEHIERYPDNVVQLYDRFGALVFEQQGYNNDSNNFVGLGNKGIRPGGNELPEGTYFYKIKTAAKAPVLQGFIVLKK